MGDYVLQGDGAGVRFEKMKDAVLSSLATYLPIRISILFYTGIYENARLLENYSQSKPRNIKLAIDWITGLGSSLEDLKVNRNQLCLRVIILKASGEVVGPCLDSVWVSVLILI